MSNSGEQVKCPVCDTMNPANAKECIACGLKMKNNSGASGEQIKCPVCDTMNPADAKECATCGAVLEVKEGGLRKYKSRKSSKSRKSRK